MTTKRLLELRVNGITHTVASDADATLLEVLRETIGLTGTKWGCLTGDCGACTVLVDDLPVVSCLQLASQVEGRDITTIEGLGGPAGELSEVQASFVRNGAAQCGFCTPGMIMSSEALIRAGVEPDETAVREGLAGNLCRCTGYNKIIDAVVEVARGRE